MVDDGSKDRTSDLARSAGAVVLKTPVNLGKGRVMKFAVDQLPKDADVAFFDADLVGLRPFHAQRMMSLFNLGYDMVCGLRDRDRRINVRSRNVLQAIFPGRNLMQITFSPIITGERVLRRSLVDSIPESCWSGYSIETAMNHSARQSGARTCLFFMDGVTIRDKTEKVGVLKGALGYWKMFSEMARTKEALNGSCGRSCS